MGNCIWMVGEDHEDVEWKYKYCLFFLERLENLHREGRGQVNIIVIKHFNGILFYKSKDLLASCIYLHRPIYYYLNELILPQNSFWRSLPPINILINHYHRNRNLQVGNRLQNEGSFKTCSLLDVGVLSTVCELLAVGQGFGVWQFSVPSCDEIWCRALPNLSICNIIIYYRCSGVGWKFRFTQYAIQETKSYIQHWIPPTTATSNHLLRRCYGSIANIINHKVHILYIISESKIFHNIYKS